MRLLLKVTRQFYCKWIYLVALTGLAFYLRFWFISHIPTQQLFDFATYQEIAKNIFLHHQHSLRGQPVAWQGMGYSTLLGLFYIIMGNTRVETAQILNAILSCLSLPLMYLIFRKLSSNSGVVLGAYTLVALLPNYIAYNNVVGTEVFVTLLFLIILVLQLYPFDGRIRYPLIGIFIGLAALTKPFFLVYPLVATAYMWLHSKDMRQTVFLLLGSSLLMLAVISPWTLHNYRNFGSLIPVSYNSGYVLYVNNNDKNVNGNWMPLDQVPASAEMASQIKQELAANQDNVKLAPGLDKLLKPAALEWISQHPAQFLQLGVLRLTTTFFSGAQDIGAWTMNDIQKTEWQKKSSRINRNINFFYALADILVNLLCSCGILYLLLNIKVIIKRLFSRRGLLSAEILIPSLNTAFFIAVYFVFEGQPRYNYPLLFLFAISLMIMLQKTNAALQGSQT
jgi:hypothetical protein